MKWTTTPLTPSSLLVDVFLLGMDIDFINSTIPWTTCNQIDTLKVKRNHCKCITETQFKSHVYYFMVFIICTQQTFAVTICGVFYSILYYVVYVCLRRLQGERISRGFQDEPLNTYIRQLKTLDYEGRSESGRVRNAVDQDFKNPSVCQYIYEVYIIVH